MPVTAKLSRRFYEKFGDDITNELVDWLNSVDVTYRSDLRELNELNFARFSSTMDQKFAEAESSVTRQLSDLRSELLKWMFVYWTGTVVAVAALSFAMLRR
jgi:hypothetical protein